MPSGKGRRQVSAAWAPAEPSCSAACGWENTHIGPDFKSPSSPRDQRALDTAFRKEVVPETCLGGGLGKCHPSRRNGLLSAGLGCSSCSSGVIKSRAVKELYETESNSERPLGKGNFLLPYNYRKGPLRNRQF